MSDKIYNEQDNLGTRQETAGKADGYWTARLTCQLDHPFILYTFDREEDAREALLELPCIHVAEDSGKLICTEVLTYGVHPTEHLASGDDGAYATILAGADMTCQLYRLAEDSFKRHGGRRKNDQELEDTQSTPEPATARAGDDVTFLREDKQVKMGHTLTYRVHKAHTAEAAKAFLQENPVTQPLLYLVVETPSGNYCRDVDGIYQE